MPASAASMAEPAKSCASLSADRSNERALLAFGGSERMTRRSATVPQASMELPTTPIASAGYGLAAPQRGDGETRRRALRGSHSRYRIVTDSAAQAPRR